MSMDMNPKTNPNLMSTTVSAGGKVSREEWRRQKDLDAARKAGTAPAQVDEDGRAINPHIPEYITKAPWYVDTGRASLNHQRRHEEEQPHKKLDEWYDRGAKVGPASKKFRKGACENCGAMTHKRKDCVERPRKRGAKFTNKDIMADELIQDISGDYDAKRDRWNGYDPASYKIQIEEYEATEEARKKLREEEIDKQTSTDMAVVKKIAKEDKDKEEDFGSSDEDDADEDKYAEAADAVGQKLDTKTRVTVRNLRIREDTAKYLINLDPESAYYDPKTRSMRDAPEQGLKPEDMKFAGDNFLRFSGDATNIQKLQLFAWQSAARGNNVHMNANPTQGELLHKEFQEKKEVLKDTSKVSILSRYGGEEHLERVPRELLTGQTEEYIEYSRTGEVIKGREKAKARSKYEEDIYLINHTAVWGSWYDMESGTWGFQCCHSIISASYCTGEAGKNANQASSVSALLDASAAREAAQPPPQALIDTHLTASSSIPASTSNQASGSKNSLPQYSKTRLGDGDDVELDKSRLKKALEDEKKRKNLDSDSAWEDSKRKKTEVTQEELEAYRLSKAAFDDPMAKFKDDDKLLDY